MELTIEFAVVRSRHSEAVSSIIAKLRKGTSRHKTSRPEELVWKYTWAVEVEGFSVDQLFSGAALRRQEADRAMTVDEAVTDLVRRTGVALEGSRGRWTGYARLAEVPPEVVAVHRREVVRQRAERAAFEALPPEERERQAQEALRELRKDPGFVEVTVPLRGPPRGRREG